MSVQSAKDFLEKISNDEAFKNGFMKLETADEKKTFFKNEGYDFSKEEFEGAKSELSDADLDSVAAGACFAVMCVQI